MSDENPPIEPGGTPETGPEPGKGGMLPVHPDALRADREAAGPDAVRQPADTPAPQPKRTLGQAFLDELWADNAFTVTLLAIVLAAIVGAVLMVLGDEPTRQQWAYFFYQPGKTLSASWDLVSSAYGNMFKGSIIDPDSFNRWIWGVDNVTWQRVMYPISETLTFAAPLIFTGLASALPFRAGLFNIGGQGQAIMGAIGGATVGFAFSAPGATAWILSTLAGALFGALYGLIVGVLKARTGAHEVIVTIMMNYIALLFLGWYILQKGIHDPNRPDAISKPVHPQAMFPKIFGPTATDAGLRANLGIVLALLAAWGVSWLLRRGTFGFELRAVGYNQDAARTAGMSVGLTLALTMGLAGALAGLGGVTMVHGDARALSADVVGQIGFNGILVALLGRVKPWGVVWAGLLFGAMTAGGLRMQADPGISTELVTVIQALIVMFVAAPMLVKAIFRLRKSPSSAAHVGLAQG
ncbi:ABC transporter permease [Hamadaea tsunoensis]|uniref:ABC transporter permease n=1 Tax=Hamadaea tsunoensis TaxID=53368 RepID=UPI0003FEADDB|nr:ABC transporter permease [Hamadaea tsunoensis]